MFPGSSESLCNFIPTSQKFLPCLLRVKVVLFNPLNARFLSMLEISQILIHQQQLKPNPPLTEISLKNGVLKNVQIVATCCTNALGILWNVSCRQIMKKQEPDKNINSVFTFRGGRRKQREGEISLRCAWQGKPCCGYYNQWSMQAISCCCPYSSLIT